MKNRKGFTMIELLVAVAIMGVLTIIAIPSVKRIQTNNQKTKYTAYEKTIASAAKLYTDSYNEDLFGINTGCAVIKYSDLKEKGLVDDIQLKSTNCGKEDTYILVTKAKNNNYTYETHVVCREDNTIVYGESSSPKLCKLEDGNGPDVTIEDRSPVVKTDAFKKYGYYKKGEKPKIEVDIYDPGVGIKARQKLQYVWTQSGKSGNIAEGTYKFNNPNYLHELHGVIPQPATLGDNITDTTTFKLKITGTLSDVAGNKTPVEKEITITYYVSKVNIRLNANGGKFTGQYDHDYTIDVHDNLKYKNQLVRYTLKEWESLPAGGLVDWNSSSQLNMTRPGFGIKYDKEWSFTRTGERFLNQRQAYHFSTFCNEKYKDCNVTLYLNWKQYITLTATFVYQGVHGYFNSFYYQYRSCQVLEAGDYCTVTSPGINNLPYTAVSGCGSPYYYLLVVQGWNADPNAGYGFYGNVAINGNPVYYSIITPNYYYLWNFNVFTVYAYSCDPNHNNRNVVERYAPYDNTYWDPQTCIKEGHHFAWTGGWTINGNYKYYDTDDGAWFYLVGFGSSCRKVKGNHAATTCYNPAYIKAYQLAF